MCFENGSRDTSVLREVHHSDYENYVNGRTSSYNSEFSAFLTFDGNLPSRDPYDAALLLALDTTLGGATGRNATWMDQHYDWSNTEFRNRVGQSINLAVNYLADVLHAFWLAAGQPIPEFQTPSVVFVVSAMAFFVARHLIGSKFRFFCQRRCLRENGGKFMVKDNRLSAS